MADDLTCNNINPYQSIMTSSPSSLLYSSVDKKTEDINYTPIQRDNFVTPPKPAAKASPTYNFAENEQNVCIDKNYDPESVTPALFTANMTNSNIVASMNLKLKDHNGFNNRAQNDISGEITSGNIELSRDLFDKNIFGMKGYNSKEGNRTTSVKDVKFDSNEKAYIFDIKVEQDVLGVVPVWDNFKVKFKVDDKGQLTAKLEKNWVPDSKILSKLEDIIKNKINSKIPKDLSNISLDIKKEKGQLKIIPKIENLEVPLANQGFVNINSVDSEKAKFNIDTQGNMNVGLSNIKVSGSTTADKNAPKASQDDKNSDYVNLELKLGIGKDNTKQVYASGTLGIKLDEKETAGIKLNNETLSNYFKSGEVRDNFSIYVKQGQNKTPEIKSKNSVFIKDAQLGDQKADLVTRLKLNFDPKEGIQLTTIEPKYSPLNLTTSNNGVEFFVNGKEYFPQMKEMIKNAKSSINLETYEFHDDPSGREAAYLLAQKAAGIATANTNIKWDPKSKDGVEVKVIFNSGMGDVNMGKRSENVFKSAIKKVEDEIDQSKLSTVDKQKAKDQLHNNLNYKFFTDGILRSDHRKVFVVDGGQATVGGMNMGSNYLSEDAYHDVMLKVAGPEVRKIQKEFLENWFEFNKLPQPSEKEWNNLLKSENELKLELEGLQAKGNYKSSANMATLVTDDKQTDIEQGIIKLIDEAKTEINIEQAFFSDSKINDHLKSAMQRGVKINVIVAESSIIKMFDYANLDSVYGLVKAKKEGAKGDIKLYYYNNAAGRDTKFIHTKAITVDDNKAIIGSANMIGRSLSSPFMKVDQENGNSQALFNKELSLYMDDPKFVNQINSRLFGHDILNNTRELDIAEIEKQVKKLGGESELKKKALMATLS